MTGDNAALSGAAIDCYLKNKDIYDHVVFYEDIIADPVEIAGGLFEALGIRGEGMVERAITALEAHSQVRASL